MLVFTISNPQYFFEFIQNDLKNSLSANCPHWFVLIHNNSGYPFLLIYFNLTNTL